MLKKHCLSLKLCFLSLLTIAFLAAPSTLFAEDDASTVATMASAPEEVHPQVQKVTKHIELHPQANLVCGRTATTPTVRKLSGLELKGDVPPLDWAKRSLIEGTITPVPVNIATNDFRDTVGYRNRIFKPGVHEISGALYAFNRYGNLLCNQRIGAYYADANGQLTLLQTSYKTKVPYISMLDNLDADVGCEPISALMGLQAKGYATDVSPEDFLHSLPHSDSNPKNGFVGSPYGDDLLYTSIDPEPLADYCNHYCPDSNPCQDFSNQSITAVQQELLAGNVLACYQTYWWEPIFYDYFLIDDELLPEVANNHVRLICGYDMERGYFVSDPYNPETPNKDFQYWIDAETFEWLWNQRQKAMIIR